MMMASSDVPSRDENSVFQVNGVDLRGASHEEAIAALRQTPAKVLLTVLRDEAQYRDEENLDVFEVELQKKSGRGLGFSIVGKRSALNIHTHTVTLCVGYYHTCVFVCVRSGSGVFISEVVKGGAAELDGRLMQGDQILSVNSEDTRHASQEAVAAMLKVTHTHTSNNRRCVFQHSDECVNLTCVFCSVFAVRCCWSLDDSKLLPGSPPDRTQVEAR